MKNIFTKMAATVATGAVLSVAIAANAPKAEAASYKLFWEGEQGYTATGAFSFSNDLLGGLVTKDELSDFMISFFNPAGTLLESFGFDSVNKGEFNFNFDSATETILQTGGFEEDTGFDFGIDYGAGETGLDFYTAQEGREDFPVGTIILDDNFVPNSQVEGSEYVTLDSGGTLSAEKVPEPASVLGLLAFGAVGASLTRKKKQASC